MLLFFFKQKTAYEMRISDWSSDVCSSDLHAALGAVERVGDIGEVGDICRTIDRSVAAERARNFPGPVIGELAAKAEGALPGFGLLEEFSRPALDEHAAHEQQILSRDRKSTRLNSSH